MTICFFNKNPSLRTVAHSSALHRIKKTGRTDGRTDMTDGQDRTGQDSTEQKRTDRTNGQSEMTVRNDCQK